MSKQFSHSDLEAYLDEALPEAALAEMEQALRADSSLLEELAAINARRDSGSHSIATIWRRHRVSCPTRQDLSNFLLQILSAEQTQYLNFHVETVGCRYCQANLDDLKDRQTESSDQAATRRRKYFQSSAGHLRKR
jgi:hypothetical protein